VTRPPLALLALLLSATAPASAQAQEGDPAVERHGPWQVGCRDDPAAGEPVCLVFQDPVGVALSRERGEAVLVGEEPAPFSDVTARVDGGPPVRWRVFPGGRGPEEGHAGLVERMRRGSTLRVVWRERGGGAEPAVAAIGLEGFGRAFERALEVLAE
jgi:invasion protein IalB